MLLVVGAVLAASVVVALGAARTGLPVLVAFLGLGMLLGPTVRAGSSSTTPNSLATSESSASR